MCKAEANMRYVLKTRIMRASSTPYQVCCIQCSRCTVLQWGRIWDIFEIWCWGRCKPEFESIWLPVKYRCMFKTATLVYKFLHSGSPSYFQPFLSLSSCSYSTRRSHPELQYLTVPLFRSSVFKSVKHFDHSFAFDAPKIWNELPHDVRSAASVASFRKKLKTYLFAKAYPP